MDPLNLTDVLLRIGCALAAGLVVGYERERHGRAAGLRTNMIVAVAAAVAMILSESLFIERSSKAGWQPDPARLAAGILTGIGFLGAGVIIRHGNVVRGVTTAAVLWFVTILGLAFGSGHFQLGFVGLGIVFVALFLLPSLEGVIEKDWYATLVITAPLDGLTEEELSRQIESLGAIVKQVSLDYDLSHKQRVIRCELKLKKPESLELPQKVVRHVSTLSGITHVKWE